MAQDWAADVKKYDVSADDGAIAGLVRYCGIALRKPDSALVAMSDAKETGRVRDNFLKKKLGLTQSDAELDAAIKRVGEQMKADRTKNRVTVYYLLAKQFGKLDAFASAKAAAKPAAKKPATAAKAPATKSAAPAKKAAAPKPAAKATTAKSTKVKAQTLAQSATAAAPAPTPSPTAAPAPSPAPAAAKPQPLGSSAPKAAADEGGSMMWLLWVVVALVVLWLIWHFLLS